MDSWNCCRACLGVGSLHPIFPHSKHHAKYSEVIFCVTGLKVEFTDTLPKQMCTECINFINTSYKFRKKCEENHKTLLYRLNEREILDIKLESNVYGPENVTIDISDIKKNVETFNDNVVRRDYFNKESRQKRIFDNRDTQHCFNDIGGTQKIFSNHVDIQHDFNDKVDIQQDFNDHGDTQHDFNDKVDIQHDFNDHGDTQHDFKDKETTQHNVSDHVDTQHEFNDHVDTQYDHNDNGDIQEDINNDSIESNCNEDVEFETQVQDIVDKPIEVIFKKKKKSKCNGEKPVRHSTKKKNKENGIKKKAAKRAKKPLESVECDHCHKVLRSKLSLRNHLKIHTGFDIVCEHCGKKFITRRLLLMHCRSKHGYEKTDKCSFCDYKACNAEQVKIHERLHTGEKPYVCSECGVSFHRKSSYLQHAAIHLPDKTVQCDQCPARFKSVTLMKIHKNRHKGPQYSYKCTLCENTFSRRRNVCRHLLRIHSVVPSDEYINRFKIAT